MNISKVGLFVVILVIANQVSATHVPRGDDDVDYQLIGAFVNSVVQVATKIIEPIVTEGSNIIEKFGTNLDDIQKKTVDVSVQVISGVEKIIERLIDRASDKANANTKIVSQCLKTNSDDIIKIIVSFWDETTKCFNPSLKNLTQNASPALKGVNTLLTKIQSDSEQLPKCTDLSCITGVGVEFVDDAGTWWGTEKPLVNDLFGSVVSFLGNLIQCNIKEITAWKGQAIDEFNKVSDCFRA